MAALSKTTVMIYTLIMPYSQYIFMLAVKRTISSQYSGFAKAQLFSDDRSCSESNQISFFTHQ